MAISDIRVHHTPPTSRTNPINPTIATKLPSVSHPEHDPERDPEHDPEVTEFATRLFGNARSGHTQALDAYLQAGLPPNMTNQSGDTLLMLAAYHGHPDTVELLLKHGADPDRLNDRGQSPLAGAIFKGEEEVVKLLVGAGADPDAGTPSARASAQMFGKLDLLALFGD